MVFFLLFVLAPVYAQDVEYKDLSALASRLEFVSSDELPSLGQGFSSNGRRLLSQCLRQSGLSNVNTPARSFTKSTPVNEFSHYSNVEQSIENTSIEAKLNASSEALDVLANVATEAAANEGSSKSSAALDQVLGTLTGRLSGRLEVVSSHYYLTRVERLVETEVMDLQYGSGHPDKASFEFGRQTDESIRLFRMCGDQFVRTIGYGYAVNRKVTVDVINDSTDVQISLPKQMTQSVSKGLAASLGAELRENSVSVSVTIRQDYRGLIPGEAVQAPAIAACTFLVPNAGEVMSPSTYDAIRKCFLRIVDAEKKFDAAQQSFVESISRKVAVKTKGRDADANSQIVFFRTANFEEALPSVFVLGTAPLDISAAQTGVKTQLQRLHQYLLILREAVSSIKLRRFPVISGVGKLKRYTKRFFDIKRGFSLAQDAYQACNSFRLYAMSAYQLPRYRLDLYLKPELSSREMAKALRKGAESSDAAALAATNVTGYEACLVAANLLDRETARLKIPSGIRLRRFSGVSHVR